METNKLKNIVFIILIIIVMVFYISAFYNRVYLPEQEEKDYCYLMVADENSTAFGAKTDECDMLYNNCISEAHNIDCEWKTLADNKNNKIAVCQCNAKAQENP